jgi:hypothetical protein
MNNITNFGICERKPKEFLHLLYVTVAQIVNILC